MSSAVRGTELYKQDLVKGKTSGNIGMVSSCYDDKNEVGVIWIDETDSIECINNVEVLDRRLMPGDYVASTSNPMGQLGTVVDMDISVDVLTCDGEIIKNVNAKRLRRVGYFAVGDDVILGPWLGRVEEILDTFRVTFDDGSAYDIMNAEQKSINFPFYPGQRVRVVGSSDFKKLFHRLEGTVTEVTVGSIIVCWVASADSGSATSPNEEQNPEDLKLLDCFAHTNWQLGDWCLLSELKEECKSSRTRSEGSQVLSSEESCVCIESANEYCPLRRKRIQKVVVKRARKDSKKDDEFERAVVIVNTKTSVDVVWQDGGLERCRNSRSLIPIESLDDHQFLVDQYVVEKALDDPSELKRAGVIENVNQEEKTACVKWFKRIEDPTAFDDEKMVSAYELEVHPDFNFCYGDVVLRLSSIAQLIPTSEASFKSCIGNITKFRNGGIEVTWADGVVSMVGPQAIYVVDSDDDEPIEDDVVGASWETDKDDEIEPLEDAIEVRSPSTSDDDSDYDESIGDHAESWETEEDNEFETLENATEYADDDEIKISEQDDYELLSVTDAICSMKLDARRFDITSDPHDHHFVDANVQFNADNKWLKKVQKDWNMLKNNLPDGIYVRVYEDRMDLLRVGIVGADGTPYHDGIFFFDFHLPSDYPDVPPSAYYHSGGWRINPNLYNEGKVCLSLLNTWSGRGNEMWDPSSSSILQVLLSLQGLVLNSKPYFNEAGYDKQIGTAEGEQRSVSYNESTFLLNCKTMMHFMRKPPKDFEDIVQEHFKTRGYSILKACDAYMKGYLVASLAKDATITSSSIADSNTTGFKIMLTKLVSKLYSSFSDIGANCKDFEHFQSLGT